MRHSALLRALSRCLAIAAATHLLACDLNALPNHTKPPFAPWAVNLPEIGRIRGTITPCARQGRGENFARDFHGVGDVNNDGLDDWVVSRERCDTVIAPQGSQQFERHPIDLLLFLGIRGGVPSASAGIRVGPSESDALTFFIAAGDFDADGHRDLVIRYELLLDTSDNDPALVWESYRLAVLWGDGTGLYDIADSTRLPCETNQWLVLVQAIGYDIDQDGVDDLLVYGLGGFSNGAPAKIVTLRIFAGRRGSRWGLSKPPTSQAVWRKWNSWSVTHGRLSVLDQDCDGAADIVFYYDNNAGPSRITVLYGQRGGFPDTTEFESLEPIVANGRAALFSDVTGDGSPELLLNCGSHQSVKIFAGRSGQRLLEQYGFGLEPPTAGRGWWGRPWAEIWEPSRLNSSWSLSAGYAGFFELGDISTDGIDEIWIHAEPYVLGYRTLDWMDSLADAWLRYNGELTHAARLGDIDGSGRVTVAVSYDFYPHDLNFPFPGEMILLQSTPAVTGLAWRYSRQTMPHLEGERCGDAPVGLPDDDAIRTANGADVSIALVIRPNPAFDAVALELHGVTRDVGRVTYALFDANGSEVVRGVFATTSSGLLDASSLEHGLYVVLVLAGGRRYSGLLRR